MAIYQIVANEEEQTKIQLVKKATINAGAVISVLGIRLMSAVEKSTDGTRVLVCPSTENPKQSVKLNSVCESASISKDKQDSIDSIIKYLGLNGGIAEPDINVY